MTSSGPELQSAYFSAPIATFRIASVDSIVGEMTRRNPFTLTPQAIAAWSDEIVILQLALEGIDGHVFLEYDIPRLGTRVDAVVIADAALFPIEFKVGASEFHVADLNQAWDYGLDLKNFHSKSHDVSIFPILVATEATENERGWGEAHPDGVRRPLKCNARGLAGALRHGISLASGSRIDGVEWGTGTYQPTPTIVEAARALYARHTVQAISRNDAGAKNLTTTTRRIEEIIKRSRDRKEKAVVFVTGVPGAGKTLVGLNIATQHRRAEDLAHAVFLSGNQPLVDVLHEALVRDEVSRLREAGQPARKGAVAQGVKQFIQNIHHFRDAGIKDRSNPPSDHVAVFDESQRAWNREKTSDFMRRKKGVPDFQQSEAEFLLSYMDRHRDWAVVICLVGGGQEIHTGEAGITSWLEAARDQFKSWQIYVSGNLTESEYAAADTLATLKRDERTSWDPDLHLDVSMRSFRSEHVAEFVRCLLDLDVDCARAALGSVREQFPIAITRNLDVAKAWVRTHARGTERTGIVASSQAMRLKPHAIDIRVAIDPVHWFLDEPSDTRSSCFLEDAATEFQVQGLEVDWLCVSWDADLRMRNGAWGEHDFVGGRWRDIRQKERKRYLLNSYRVLLTRARQGLVIFVPPGSDKDQTRQREFYDQTYGYLRSLGIDAV